jgi:hypothetical protein
LPQEYGGTQPPFENFIWRESIFENEDYFERLETFSCGNPPEEHNNSLESASLKGEHFDYIDDETDDSEFDENDPRILSPRRKHFTNENIEALLLRKGVDDANIPNEAERRAKF